MYQVRIIWTVVCSMGGIKEVPVDCRHTLVSFFISSIKEKCYFLGTLSTSVAGPVAEWPKTCNVFVCSEDGIVGSNPTQDMDV
jgi:hypothetical protein